MRTAMRSNSAFGIEQQFAVAQCNNGGAALLPEQPAGFAHQLTALDLRGKSGFCRAI